MDAETYDHILGPIRTQEGWPASLWRGLRTRANRIYSDETLVRRARARDYAAFDALVDRYRNRLYTMALDSLGSEGKARDALCEMVLSAFKDIDSFNERCSPGTWLYLHGLRAVFKSMDVSEGKYTVESSAGAASRNGDSASAAPLQPIAPPGERPEYRQGEIRRHPSLSWRPSYRDAVAERM